MVVIEDYIRQNETFRDALLKQDGGFMKYLAEYLPDHPGVYLDIELLRKYQEHYYKFFLKDNRGNYDVAFMEESEKKYKAFGYDHLVKELSYQNEMIPTLSNFPKDIVKEVNNLIYKYMEYAWMANRKFLYSDDTPPELFYREIIELYDQYGIAHICMDYLLREHHHPEAWAKEKTVYHLFWEFLMKQYSTHIINLGHFLDLRQTIKDMTEGKTAEECRQMALETMYLVKHFSQMLYSTSEATINDCTGEYIADKEWLRKQAGITPFDFSSIYHCFANFVSSLELIGRIWAARLLRIHHIDMHELEKETGCILYPVTAPAPWPDGLHHGNYFYYVDKDLFLIDKDCCISNQKQAKALLEKIKPKCQETADDGIGLPKDLDRPVARMAFREAIAIGYMKKTEDGRFRWIGTGDRGQTSQLAYFLGKVYNYKHTISGNTGENFPDESLCRLFGEKNLYKLLAQVHNAKKTQSWRSKIDAIFEE